MREYVLKRLSERNRPLAVLLSVVLGFAGLSHLSPLRAATWTSTDIGAVGAAGGSSQSAGTFTVQGSGTDIWGTADAFQFYYQTMTGNGTITARVVSQTDTNNWAKAGVMIRATLDAGSRHASTEVTTVNGITFQRRSTTNGTSASTSGPLRAAPYWVRITRSGNTFTSYASADGITWTTIGQDTVSMGSAVYAGLAVTSHNAGAINTAQFDNVTLSATGWSNTDIGPVGAAGSSAQSGNTFTLRGAGADIWGNADAFQFDYQPLTGDGTITARAFGQTDTNSWAKAGVMIRETLAAGAKEASVVATPANGVAFLRRVATGGISASTVGPLRPVPYWVRLTRAGNTFTASASPDGVTWMQISQDTILMANAVYVGLAITSHDAGVIGTAQFDNLTIATSASVWSNGDIGAVGATGSSTQSGNTFTLRGSGADIWGNADAFQFDYQTLTGDGTITTRVFSQTNTNTWAKAGVMIRETLAAGSKEASVVVTPAHGVIFQRRQSTGGTSTTTVGPLQTVPYWVRLTRAGTTFVAFASLDGVTWTQIAQDTISMTTAVYAGLAVSSHNAGAISTAQFDNVNLGSSGSAPCNPLSFGAAGNGTREDTNAIQSAIDTCASRGGGTVQLSALSSSTTYLTAPITLRSHIQLQVDEGVTLKGTNDHSRYVPAYINWVYQPNEALVSAKGATDVGVTGAGIIDGSGGQAQPNGGLSWWDLGRQNTSLPRPWLVEFYQCDHVTMSGVTLRNSPMWTQVFRFSNTIDASGLIINTTDPTAPNTDGVDVVGSTNVTLSDLNIAVGDDNIAIKSGLPIDPNDPKQQGLPRMASSQIHISNITAGSGHGISIGSEAVNGVNNVTIQGVHYTWTGNGIRIKSNRNRGNQIYAITASDITMSHVSYPLIIDMYYMAGVSPSNDPAHAITSTTPFVHDITIRNLTATGANEQSIVQGLPESCLRNLTLDNVSIQTSNLGLALRHVTGSFNNVTSTPGGSNPSFVVLENVHVTTSGTTPSIPATPPLTGQIACASQVTP